MKKQSLLFIALLLLMGIRAFGQETAPVNEDRDEWTIHPIGDFTGEIKIDGLADELFWAKIAGQALPHDVTNSWFQEGTINTEPSEDFRVNWKATMDNQYFYLFCDITDESLVSRSMVTNADAWVNDNIELFFLFADTTVVMPAWSLTEATQWRIWPDLNEVTGDSVTAGGWASGAVNLVGTKYQPLGYKTKTIKTVKGYNVEARIPLKLIIPSVDVVAPIDSLGYWNDDDVYVPFNLNALDVFQFDINVADRDDATAGKEREYIWSWSAKWNRNWGFTIGYGRVNVGDPVLYPETTEYGPAFRAEMFMPVLSEGSMVIDGKAEEAFWSKLSYRNLPLDITNSWFSSGTVDAAPGTDFDARWKATMDNQYFYVFCSVTDESLVSRSMVTNADAWVNDNVELFFLFADTTVVMPAWSLTEATQWRIWPDLNEVTGDSVTAGGWASGAVNLVGVKYQPLGYKTKTIKTAKGYDVEARIPLKLIIPSVDAVAPIDSLGYWNDDDVYIPFDFKKLKSLQFDINIADRDDASAGKEREYIWGWSADWNRNWGFTKGYGLVKLMGTLNNPLTSLAQNVPVGNIIVYPNPVYDILTITNLEGVNQVTVHDMVGKQVLSGVNSDERMDLNVSNLKPGMYIVKVANRSGSFSTAKILKK